MNYPKFKYIENAEDVIQFSDKTKKTKGNTIKIPMIEMHNFLLTPFFL